MSASEQQHAEIDAYVAGELTPEQAADVEQHIAGCEECGREVDTLRELQEILGEVPPEALLEGYPEDADLVLQRTLRRMRTESTTAQRRTRLLTVAAAVVAAAVLVTGGVFVGQSTSSTEQSADPTTAQPTATQPPGVRFASATDSVTGARITARITPAMHWLRINAAVSGIPAGEPCRLIIVSKNGTRESAGSWVVPPTEKADGTTLDGSALIPAEDVASVIVETTTGKQYVSVNV
ncbi:zf-HC2 domain-containing protein [Kibdelosporangium philippinense]|uniref:Zf-HC2 domain-containing protein n=1 Tax=Kibdelosporangium philippinense TaxID=211113 RepID=A0ABS8Z4X6_9PSEU|nr:zf-HC2 domain-containing protein [Kibdelosporangium philippinense]MCE7002954.1 zf-HC2 domain-containing protein [Kibdelosporangium philippinense]